MSYSTIRDEIKAQLESVTGIGTVHDYRRWAVREDTLAVLFKPAAQAMLHAWQITRLKTPEEYSSTNKASRRIYTFEIEGIMSHKDADATERTFQDMVEAICAKFRPLYDLNDKAERIVEPIQVEDVGLVYFGDGLCHIATLTLEVQEQVTW